MDTIRHEKGATTRLKKKTKEIDEKVVKLRKSNSFLYLFTT